jgi:hypothetical protein
MMGSCLEYEARGAFVLGGFFSHTLAQADEEESITKGGHIYVYTYLSFNLDASLI